MLVTTLIVLCALSGISTTPSLDDPASTVEATNSAPITGIPRMRPMRVFKDVRLKRPIQILVRPDLPDLLYVVEQPGRILMLDRTRPDAAEAATFLDIRPEVRMKHNEEGLLSMAFSPDVANDGLVYLYYTASDPRRAVLSRFKIDSDGQADPESEEILLEVPQPFGNHNGGTVAFGPDDLLYLSLGDGGAANDPMGHGQDLSTLLGTVLRIDPDGSTDGKAYGIPADNPFLDVEDARPEIWAYGLRNIWRMSFDRETGDLWAGDVGQNQWEEIDVVRAGGNYGWRYREGKQRFSRDEPPADLELLDPVVDYPRSDGISVTGGHVYRGSARPEAIGAYLYADYQSGRIWGIRAVDGVMTEGPKQVARLRNSLISSFGEDAEGELWICTFEGDPTSGVGAIWRFTGPLQRVTDGSEAGGA